MNEKLRHLLKPAALCLSAALLAATAASAAPQSVNITSGVSIDRLDRVYFGEYFQTRNELDEFEKTPLLWRVMKDDAMAKQLTVLSEYVIDYIPYQHGGNIQSLSWSSNSARPWLDALPGISPLITRPPLLTTAFSAKERDAIDAVKLTASARSNSATYTVTTYSKLFYLNGGNVTPGNAAALFQGGESLAALPTDYAVSLGLGRNDSTGTASYLLRDGGQSASGGQYVQYVGQDGVRSANGMYIGDKIDSAEHLRPNGCRPAFTLDKDSILFASEIVADAAENPTLTTATNVLKASAVAGKRNLKLTMADYTLSRVKTAASSISVSAGQGGDLDLDSIADGTELAVKITDLSGVLKGYYKTAAQGGKLSVNTAGLYAGNGAPASLSPGAYKFYVWRQVSNARGCDFGSYPALVSLTVQ